MTKREFKAMRNKAIIFLSALGYDYKDIARLFHMTPQRSFQLCKTTKFDKKKRDVKITENKNLIPTQNIIAESVDRSAEVKSEESTQAKEQI